MINVIKRNGSKEPLDINKFHEVVKYACEGITGVSISELELKTQIQFYDNIKTSVIQETIIKAAADLITEETPNYQYVAGRLINYDLRKKVYGHYEPPHLYDHMVSVIKKEYYDAHILYHYTKEEINELNSHINHDRDYNIVYAGMEQFRGKYLVKNRVTGEFYETPQMAFMLIAMTLFASYGKDRLQWVKDYYDAISNFDISLPTPIMAGVRTPQRQFLLAFLLTQMTALIRLIPHLPALLSMFLKKLVLGLMVVGFVQLVLLFAMAMLLILELFLSSDYFSRQLSLARREVFAVVQLLSTIRAGIMR